MRRAINFLSGLGLLISVCGQSASSSEPPIAVASIGPLHALLVQVTRGISNPAVVLPVGASPHHYALRPSEATLLELADIIFWIGPSLEGSLAKPIRALGEDAIDVAFIEEDHLSLLARREGGVVNHPNDSDKVLAGPDSHIWLDPVMAGVVMGVMADELAKIDPARASLYEDNADVGQQALNQLVAEVSAYLNPLRQRPYLVFHDAYQYFENRFGLAPVAIVSVDSDRPPGARRIAEIREVLRQVPGACVFVEPQFTPRLMETLREGTETRTAILDPVGMNSETGLAGYESMIRTLARNLGQCLE